MHHLASKPAPRPRGTAGEVGSQHSGDDRYEWLIPEEFGRQGVTPILLATGWILEGFPWCRLPLVEPLQNPLLLILGVANAKPPPA